MKKVLSIMLLIAISNSLAFDGIRSSISDALAEQVLEQLSIKFEHTDLEGNRWYVTTEDYRINVLSYTKDTASLFVSTGIHPEYDGSISGSYECYVNIIKKNSKNFYNIEDCDTEIFDY